MTEIWSEEVAPEPPAEAEEGEESEQQTEMLLETLRRTQVKQGSLSKSTDGGTLRRSKSKDTRRASSKGSPRRKNSVEKTVPRTTATSKGRVGASDHRGTPKISRRACSSRAAGTEGESRVSTLEPFGDASGDEAEWSTTPGGRDPKTHEVMFLPGFADLAGFVDLQVLMEKMPTSTKAWHPQAGSSPNVKLSTELKEHLTVCRNIPSNAMRTLGTAEAAIRHFQRSRQQQKFAWTTGYCDTGNAAGGRSRSLLPCSVGHPQASVAWENFQEAFGGATASSSGAASALRAAASLKGASPMGLKLAAEAAAAAASRCHRVSSGYSTPESMTMHQEHYGVAYDEACSRTMMAPIPPAGANVLGGDNAVRDSVSLRAGSSPVVSSQQGQQQQKGPLSQQQAFASSVGSSSPRRKRAVNGRPSAFCTRTPLADLRGNTPFLAVRAGGSLLPHCTVASSTPSSLSAPAPPSPNGRAADNTALPEAHAPRSLMDPNDDLWEVPDLVKETNNGLMGGTVFFENPLRPQTRDGYSMGGLVDPFPPWGGSSPGKTRSSVRRARRTLPPPAATTDSEALYC